MSRKTLSPDRVHDSERLIEIWNEKKSELGLSQAKVAELFGIKNQTAISQYLNGRIPLNMEAAIKFAKVLEVPVAEISPSFASWFNTLPACVQDPLGNHLNDGGTYTTITAAGDCLAPDIAAGDLLIVDQKDRSLDKGMFAIEQKDGDYMVRHCTRTSNEIVLSCNNRDRFPDIVIPHDAAEMMNCVGKVITVIRMIPH
jgi:transcriptional regulator with XRE-family HTH domain